MTEIIYTKENPGNFAEKAVKHIPVIEISGTTVTVKVGAELHPMTPEHLIEWIALYQGGVELARKNLSATDQPIAVFENIADTTGLKAREHCNLHGTWEN
jgi:superoxide reductase